MPIRLSVPKYRGEVMRILLLALLVMACGKVDPETNRLEVASEDFLYSPAGFGE
jgi:hypothetical protein